MPQNILERVAAGDSLAVEECLQRYGRLVWSLALRLCPNRSDAEDAVQEVFIEVWQHASRFDPQVASEATYITMIARRRLIDRLRRWDRSLDTTPIEDEIVESDSGKDRQGDIEEEITLARKCMKQLRPEQQKVLELSISQGLSQSQIAKVVNLPLGTVKTHARRGLIRLRELLDSDRFVSKELDAL